jgi:hypothetical protein
MTVTLDKIRRYEIRLMYFVIVSNYNSETKTEKEYRVYSVKYEAD